MLFVHINTCCVLTCPAATWVGGGFIVGITEMMYIPSMGLTWTIVMLLAYSSSFMFGKRFKLHLTKADIVCLHIVVGSSAS